MALKVEQNKIHMDESTYVKELAVKDKALKECFRVMAKLGHAKKGKEQDKEKEKQDDDEADSKVLGKFSQAADDSKILDAELRDSLSANLKALTKECLTIKSLLPKPPK